jgi:hypothetical protein
MFKSRAYSGVVVVANVLHCYSDENYHHRCNPQTKTFQQDSHRLAKQFQAVAVGAYDPYVQCRI